MQKSSIERLPDRRVKAVVSFEEDAVARAEAQAITSLGRDITIEGFRPGMAPKEMLRNRIGQERILEETVHILAPEAVSHLIQEEKIHPIIPPRIALTKQLPFTVEITFVEKPPVKVKGKISVPETASKVDDSDVERMVKFLLQKFETAKEVDRPAREGDRTLLEFFGRDPNGKEIDGTRASDTVVDIGGKTLIPGFEDALVGMKKGETKEFDLTFPEHYHAKELSGKPVRFTATMKKIEEVDRPALTDALAKEKFSAETADELRSRIRMSLEREEERIERDRRERQLFDAIAKATEVRLAPELVEEEAKDLLEHLLEQLKKQNLAFEDWLQRTGKKAEDVSKELREQGERRLRTRLGIEQLLLDQEIAVSDEEMLAAVTQLLSELPENDRAALRPQYEKGKNAYEQLHWQKKVEKLVDTLLKEKPKK